MIYSHQNLHLWGISHCNVQLPKGMASQCSIGKSKNGIHRIIELSRSCWEEYPCSNLCRSQSMLLLLLFYDYIDYPVFPPKLGWYPTWFYLPSCVQASCSGGSSPSENGPSVDDLPIQKCHFNSYPPVNMACWKNTPFSWWFSLIFPTNMSKPPSIRNIPM